MHGTILSVSSLQNNYGACFTKCQELVCFWGKKKQNIHVPVLTLCLLKYENTFNWNYCYSLHSLQNFSLRSIKLIQSKSKIKSKIAVL